jgi:hypothetical protein
MARSSTANATTTATSWPAFLPEPSLLEAPGGQRREAGRQHFSDALVQVLRQVSHPQLSALADWACNETGNLHTSQISHMRNNKVRMLGTRAVDALGRINQAAWVFKHCPELLPQLSCAELTPAIEAILQRYEPLLHPLSQAPLGVGDFMAVYLGYLTLPLSLPLVLSPEQAEQLAGRIGAWLDQQLSDKGLSFREGVRRLKEAWQGGAAPVDRLVRVIGGLEEYSPRQLAEEWHAIANAVCSALELDTEPSDLAEALLASA